MLLDVRTFLVIGAAFVALTGVGLQLILPQLATIGLRSSARYWVWATRILTISWLLIAFGDVLPEFATIVVANLGYLIAMFFIYQSVRCFDGLKPSKQLGTFVIPVMTLVLACRYIVDAYDVRVGIQSTAVALPLILASTHLFRRRAGQSAQEFGRRTSAVWLALCASFFLARVTMTFIQGGAPPILENGTVQTFFLGFGLVAMVGLMLTYFLLYTGKLTAELSQQAHHDALTGLLNRRAFELKGERALVTARLQNTSLAILLFDVDYFKEINDSYGHAAGDHALRTIADALRFNVRPTDIIARLGGDEFAVIVAGKTEVHIQELAKRLSDAVRTRPFGYSTHLEVSVGHAMLESTSDSLVSLIDRADKALYERKRERHTKVRPVGRLASYAEVV